MSADDTREALEAAVREGMGTMPGSYAQMITDSILASPWLAAHVAAAVAEQAAEVESVTQMNADWQVEYRKAQDRAEHWQQQYFAKCDEVRDRDSALAAVAALADEADITWRCSNCGWVATEETIDTVLWGDGPNTVSMVCPECLIEGSFVDHDPLVETLSASVHEAWMATKRDQGITSRPSEWGEEQMVPYSDLSERAKGLDRGSVVSVLAPFRAQLRTALAPVSGAVIKPDEIDRLARLAHDEWMSNQGAGSYEAMRRAIATALAVAPVAKPRGCLHPLIAGCDHDDAPVAKHEQPCERIESEVGFEDEGATCVTHNDAWDECPHRLAKHEQEVRADEVFTEVRIAYQYGVNGGHLSGRVHSGDVDGAVRSLRGHVERVTMGAVDVTEVETRTVTQGPWVAWTMTGGE